MSFRLAPIKDLIDVVTKGTTPTTIGKDFTTDGVTFIKAEALNGDSCLNSNGFSFIDEETHDRLKRAKLCENDVLITIAGANIGKCGLVKSHHLPANTNQAVGIIRINKQKAVPKFIYYFFKQNATFSYIQGLNAQAAQPNINLEMLRNILVPNPPVNTQHNIADIISAYDDLIENNRRRIKLLEQSVRLLFKEWFVYLRFPGHEHTKIINSVPEGWQRITIEEACTQFIDGDWIETKDQGGEDYRLLQISNLGENEFVETGNFRYITEETFRAKHCNEVNVNDILISRMPEPIGRAWYVYKQPWRMITAVDVTIARPNPGIVNPYFFLYHLNSSNNLALCNAKATGATRQRISRKNLGALPITIPSILIQNEFGYIAINIHEMKVRLRLQIDLASQARDLLLPRLMNGEIAV